MKNVRVREVVLMHLLGQRHILEINLNMTKCVKKVFIQDTQKSISILDAW